MRKELIFFFFCKGFVLFTSRNKAITFIGVHFSEILCVIYRKYLVFVLHHDVAVIKNHLSLWGERVTVTEFIASTFELAASQKTQWSFI